MSALLVSANEPPVVVIETPAPRDAREIACAMLTPTAAATDTPPSSVSAFGVSEESPSPEPPLSVDS